ncbi:MAG TPA: phage holin family protein [Burkholderiales bacterium]
MASTPTDIRSDGKPLMGLFSDLFRETSTLVHDEAELAKAELSEKVSRIGTGAAELAVAGGVTFAGFLVVLLAAVGALDLLIASPHAAWISPLVVGVLVMIVGYVLLRRGRHNLSAEGLAPERTLQSLRDDAQLAKEHAR